MGGQERNVIKKNWSPWLEAFSVLSLDMTTFVPGMRVLLIKHGEQPMYIHCFVFQGQQSPWQRSGHYLEFKTMQYYTYNCSKKQPMMKESNYIK